jgi:hypothetical protein
LNVINDRPVPPAAAYPIVAELLGDRWFLKRPPEKGIRVVVVGVDNVATQWDLDQQSRRQRRPSPAEAPPDPPLCRRRLRQPAGHGRLMTSPEARGRRAERKRAKARKAEQRRAERLARVPEQAAMDRRDTERWRADQARREAETYERLTPNDRGYRPPSVDPLATGTARVTGATAKAVRRSKALTRSEWAELERNNQTNTEEGNRP